MPELRDEMYCSQQICIPPSFPYLLRQYAKAAIRSQPSDLLRWSTAYFRCLSINVRPPIKPRLEYPIPKTYFGITPGWLKALTFQLQNNLHVSFKVLWDRWMGACLQHENLIEILCLGGFDDHTSISWYRIVALCTSMLTNSLTETMIMICEVLTEEPEGGSAAITLEVFLDLYKFLAAIDASHPRIIPNLYFTDSLLSLYKEPPVEIIKESASEISTVEEEEVVEAEEEQEEVVEKKSVEDLVGVVVSCPDIAPDDYKTEEDFLNQPVIEDKSLSHVSDEQQEEQEKEHKKDAEEEEELAGSKESVDTIIGYMPPREQEEPDEIELPAETTGEDFPETRYDIQGEEEQESVSYPSHFPSEEQSFVMEVSARPSEEAEEEEVSEKRNEVYMEAIPGIGGIVPLELVEAVIAYMRECAMIQHGLVMPRNVRHCGCPPLEVMPVTIDEDKKKDECKDLDKEEQ